MALGPEFETRGGAHEYRSRDGRRLLDVHLRPQGVRDLHAAFLKLAGELVRDPRATKAIIALWMPRPTDDRIEREWTSALGLFKPAIAARLALVIARSGGVRSLREDRDLRRIGEMLRSQLGREEQAAPERREGFSASFFEVFKILLLQRLLGKGPLAIGALMRRSGSSYPTVAEAIRRLERSRELERLSNRSVRLAGFPQRTWSELLVLSGGLRRARYYAESTGRRAEPMGLQRRLRSVKHVAVGGVQAARHWDPEFDLNGVPRLDVSVHAAAGAGDFSFVDRLDPALRRVEAGSPGVVLAVHPLFRAEPQFEADPKGGVGWADPVETLLDLHEMRLTDQAEELIRHLEKAPTR